LAHVRLTLARALQTAAACWLFCGCVHAQDSGSRPGVTDTSAPVTIGVEAGNDWLTFAHDQRRSGFQPHPIGVTRENVAALRLRWSLRTGETDKASPLVAGGTVYLAGMGGTVRALDARTGKPRWQKSFGGDIEMTPALFDGLLFVGMKKETDNFVAIDARTGALRWSATLPGGVRSEPVVTNGIVFEGETGGDPPQCAHGGVRAFSETTGDPLWTWYVNGRDHDGGSVWSPLAFDGDALLFGTGNTCSASVAAADAVVRLEPNGHLAWHALSPRDSRADNDFGGGTLLLGNDALVTGKSGPLYCLDARTGALRWQTPIGILDGHGGIGTPSSDGATIVASSGYLRDPTTHPNTPGGALFGLDRSGKIRWRVATHQAIFGSASIASGIVYTPLDASLAALDIRTGKKLWSYPLSSSIYASPAVVPAGIFIVDFSGKAYAFGPAP
jgi:outer membrane protein assembly factor BamB